MAAVVKEQGRVIVDNFPGANGKKYLVTGDNVYEYDPNSRALFGIVGSALKSDSPIYKAAKKEAGSAAVAPPPQTTTGDQQNGTQPPQQPTNIIDPIKYKPVLRYPYAFSSEQTFIRFSSYDYSVAQNSNQAFNVGSGLAEKVFSGFTQLSTKVYEKGIYSSETIDLYVPPNINVGYGANWGEASLGPIGSDYQGGLNNIFSKAFSSIFGSAFASVTQTGAEQISQILSNVPGTNLTGEQLIGLSTGLVYNKNEFSTFSSMNYRTFNYSFLFVARNKIETENIDKILNIFKIGMHPRSSTFATVANENYTGNEKSNSLARPPVLKYPKLWTIEYFVGDGKRNSFLPKTKYCGIQSVNINYTPNSVFTTLTKDYDYQIPAIQMDISFKELTPLIADEIINPTIVGNGYGGGINKDYSTITGENGGTF